MKLMIGTAQFGRQYGIANKSGIVTAHEAFNIIKMAIDNGINWVDTAHDYGNSEKLIGILSKRLDTKLNIVTKAFLGHLNPQPGVIIPSIKNTLDDLGVDEVYGLLIHNPADLMGDQADAVFNVLNEVVHFGMARKIGVSVSTPEQAEIITENYPLDIVQVPCNLFDQRFIQSGTIDRLASYGLEIQVRSIFLQGLFFMELENLSEHFNEVKPLLVKLHKVAEDNGVSVRKLALEYVKAIDNVERIIVGVDSSKQFKELIDDYNAPFDVSIDFKQFAVNDERFVNPGNWGCGGWRDEV